MVIHNSPLSSWAGERAFKRQTPTIVAEEKRVKKYYDMSAALQMDYVSM